MFLTKLFCRLFGHVPNNNWVYFRTRNGAGDLMVTMNVECIRCHKLLVKGPTRKAYPY